MVRSAAVSVFHPHPGDSSREGHGRSIATGTARICARVGLVALALALVSCQAPGQDGAPHPTLLTVADLQALLATATPTTAVAVDHGLPGGLPLRDLIGVDPATQKPMLEAQPTFSGAYRSVYLTTEVWAGFDEVWVQPMYVPVTGYAADGTPQRAKGADGAWHPIFGVGSGSAFYSPFWQMVTFELPTGADVASFQSVRDVIDRGLDLKPAGGYLAVLAPDAVEVPPQIAVPAAGGEPIGGPSRATGVVDGQPAPFLDFGGGTFTWNDDLVVQEAPIFMWVVRDAAGVMHTLDIPTVAGEGPLYAGRPPLGGVGAPLYGSFWRLYTVEVPAGAGVFAPSTFPDLRTRLATDQSLYTYTYAPTAEDPAHLSDFSDWAGRVALNPVCFSDAEDIDATNKRDTSCTYLDSQSAIETLVPGDSIHATGIVVTAPYITYAEVAVVHE
jgi:hypothetical protein